MPRPQHRLLADELRDDRDRALRATPVSRETTALLDRLVDLLLPAAERTNLVARSTIPVVWTRHIADSLQLVPLAPGAATWVDLGSGAGFPGLVIACALAGRAGAAGTTIHLVESVGKKAAFLREAVTRLELPAQVHNVRIEDFVKNFRDRPDAVCARALAPLDRLLHLAAPLLEKCGIGLFPKGQDVEAELTEASKYWNIAAELIPSKTSAQGRIVVVRQLSRRPLRM
jgi:16S rRNA (guanine527-N7)-methyltransferase